MGELTPRECITNAFYEDDGMRTLLSSEQIWARLVWKIRQQQHAAGHTGVGSVAVVEPMREDKEEEDKGEGVGYSRGKGSSSSKDLMLRQAPVPQWAIPTASKFWFSY